MPTDRYVGLLVETFVWQLQVKGIAVINGNDIKMGLKYVALSGLKVVKTDFNPTEVQLPMFRDILFVELKT